MVAKIIGSLWIVMGVWWLVKPLSLRNKLARKTSRRIRRMVYFFALIFGFMLIGSAFKAEGLASKLIAIVGMVLAIKAIMLMTSKTTEKLQEWWGTRPVIYFRVWASLMIFLGVAVFINP